MDQNNFFNFLKELRNEVKVFLLMVLIGVALCVVGGIFCGIPTGICLFSFKPVGVILYAAGVLIILIALLFAFA